MENNLSAKHTLFVEANIVSNYWQEFKDKYGINTSNKNFTSLKIVINNREVILDKGVKNFFPYPNKTYLCYGHKDNKKGLFIDLDNVWDEIVKDGYFNLGIEFELMPNEKVDKLSFTESTESEENIDVSFSNINMKIHVENFETGDHLTLASCGKPYGFFLMEDFKKYKQFKDIVNKYIKYEAFFVPKSTDLNTYMFWTLQQNLEFTIKPYNLQQVNHKPQDFYKIVGVVSSDKLIEEFNYGK